MNDKIRTWSLVGLLGLCLLVSYWIIEVVRRQNDEQSQNKKNRSTPDYYIEKFNFVRVSQQGKASFRVTGNKMTHFPLEDEYEIQQPRINGIDPDKDPITISADKALLKPQQFTQQTHRTEDQLELTGQVQLRQHHTQNETSLIVETESILLLPESEKIFSDHPVFARTLGAQIQAEGMAYDHSQQNLSLRKMQMVLEKQK